MLVTPLKTHEASIDFEKVLQAALAVALATPCQPSSPEHIFRSFRSVRALVGAHAAHPSVDHLSSARQERVRAESAATGTSQGVSWSSRAGDGLRGGGRQGGVSAGPPGGSGIRVLPAPAVLAPLHSPGCAPTRSEVEGWPSVAHPLSLPPPPPPPAAAAGGRTSCRLPPVSTPQGRVRCKRRPHHLRQDHRQGNPGSGGGLHSRRLLLLPPCACRPLVHPPAAGSGHV